MKKSVFGLILAVFFLVSLVGAVTYSSDMKKEFGVSASAVVSDGGDFSAVGGVAVDSSIDGLDVLIFVVGGIVIVVLIVLIVKRWLKKKPAGKVRKRKRWGGKGKKK